jgi:hypothetical protein
MERKSTGCVFCKKKLQTAMWEGEWGETNLKKRRKRKKE